MRIVIQPNYQVLSKWVANYVAEEINSLLKPIRKEKKVLDKLAEKAYEK